MVIKSKRGRRRYIAFRVESETEVGFERLARLIERQSASAGIRTPRLIEFDGDLGIVRCLSADKDGTIELLMSPGIAEGLGGRVNVLKTSGTLKTLRSRYTSGKRGREPPSPSPGRF